MISFSQILCYGKDFVSTISDFLENKEDRENLQKSGSLISLLITTIEIIEKVKESLLTEKEKAYMHFSKFILKTLNETCKEERISPREFINKDEIEKEIENDFNNKEEEKYFDERNVWKGDLLYHPIVEK